MDDKKVSILVVNGPNLNLLGERDPRFYGTQTLQQINDYIVASLPGIQQRLAQRGVQVAIDVTFYQSNHEGALIDCIQEARLHHDGIAFNPGAYTHYSYALHDAVEAIAIPVVEVHLSDISQREEFRRTSVIAPACLAQVKGKGREGYVEAIELLAQEVAGA